MKTMRTMKILACASLCMLASACSIVGGLQRKYSDFLAPEITLISFQPLASEGFEQRFLAGIRVRNPNALRVAVEGMSLRLEVNDFPVLSGVSSEIPALEPYSETTATVTVGSDLVSSLRLLVDLMNSPTESIDYKLQARVSVDLPKRRRLVLEQRGTLTFGE